MAKMRTRRDFLKASVSAGAAAVIAPSTMARAIQTATAAEKSSRIEPFPMAAVRLTGGIFKQQEEINAAYLDSLAVDRLLHSFRLTAGLTSMVTPYGGWEEPTGELRGHFAGGHYLSAVAMAYAGSGNADLRKRGDELVSGMAACQKKNANGYLSAYPEELFEKLAQGKPVWAPFYTYHKIMAGLLDMYVHTGNTEAMQAAEGMARWVGDFMYPISADQRQRMLRTEYGGMNEVLVNLAAVTKKDRYLETARYFEQPTILDPLAARRDELQGLHANTNVPKMIGAAATYEVTGDRRHRDIAAYFLEEVLAARSYAIANTSVDEHWTTPAGQLKGTLSLTNAECCVAYNLMKLERHVFGWSGDTRWMDAYERALFNCRLGTQNPQGLKQYFFPLAAGYWRIYGSPDESFWCCTGTGAEEFTKFADTIYFHRGDEVFVNQFLPSRLEWKEQGLGLEQTTNFPVEQGTTLKVTATSPHVRTIHVRIPGWTTGASLKINGRTVEAVADPGSYVAIRRNWRDGDTIALSLPMQVTQEILAGDENTVAALYGPLLLAADLGAGPAEGPQKVVHGRPTTPKEMPKADALPKVAPDGGAGQWVEVASAPELRFKAKGADREYDVMPMYRIEDQKYAVYWDRSSAKKG